MNSPVPPPANSEQAPVVRHNRALHRFEIEREGLVALLDYTERDDTWVLTHTLVPPAWRGRGMAETLTRFALETARKEKRQVDPVCSYAVTFLQRHPEYADLRGG